MLLDHLFYMEIACNYRSKRLNTDLLYRHLTYTKTHTSILINLGTVSILHYLYIINQSSVSIMHLPKIITFLISFILSELIPPSVLAKKEISTRHEILLEDGWLFHHRIT